MEFQRAACYDLMYTKMKELCWPENHGTQNTDTEDFKGNIIGDKRKVLQIWEIYKTELYDRPNWPENLQVKHEEEVYADEKGPYILHSEVERAIKEMRDKKATTDDDVPGDVRLTVERRWSQNDDTTDQQHIWSWRVAKGFHRSYNDCLTEQYKSYKIQWPLHN